MLAKNPTTGHESPLLHQAGMLLVAPVFRETTTLFSDFSVSSSGTIKDLGADYASKVICVECTTENVRVDFAAANSGQVASGSGKRILLNDEACFAPPERFIRLITDSGTASVRILQVGTA